MRVCGCECVEVELPSMPSKGYPMSGPVLWVPRPGVYLESGPPCARTSILS